MFRLIAALGLAASPAAATTCGEYIALMRAEGVRTVVALGCGAAKDVPADWNAVFDTPAGACLASRAIAGATEMMALAVYMKTMNEQRDRAGCPRLTPPAQKP